MFGFVTDLFKQAASIENDAELLASRVNILSNLHGLGQARNYDTYDASIVHIPVERSQKLVRAVAKIDPEAARKTYGLDFQP